MITRRSTLIAVNVALISTLLLLYLIAEVFRARSISGARPETRVDTAPTVRFGREYGFSYNPAHITLPAGGTLEWRGSLAEHPLISVEGLWALQAAGVSFSHTFANPGTYHYYCQLHGGTGSGGMAGVVVVQ
jgi:plastocyanin